MLNRKRRRATLSRALVAPALLLVLGCSDDDLGKHFPVSGTVDYNGKPFAKAIDQLHSQGRRVVMAPPDELWTESSLR